MPHNITLITTIVAALSFGLIFGLIALQLKLPALVGYLAAGILIGPSTPGFIADAALTVQLADIGVMLLMFGIGLHFSIDDLLAVRRIALPGAILQIVAATGISTVLARYWGWSFAESLVFGLSMSVASTVVLLRALEDRGMLESMNGRIAMGWLVVEDLVMVLVLVLLPSLSGMLTGNEVVEISEILETLAITFLQVAAFIVFMLVIGDKLFPWFLWRVARTGSRELFTLSVIAAGVGVAYGSSEFFGVSFALGAFFAGVILRKSELSHRAAEESLPLRDAFSVLFFVSVGMLFEPVVLIQHPTHVLAAVAIIVLGKSLVAFVLVLALRYPLNTALTVSASLAQIGEFSFVLAALGLAFGLLSVDAHSIILVAALISIAINPIIFKLIIPLQKWLLAHSAFTRRLDRSANRLESNSHSSPHPTNHDNAAVQVVLIGYGKVGVKIADSLLDHGISFTIVERNRRLVERLRKLGIAAVAGNGAEPSVLIRAHISKASMLIIAVPDTFLVRSMVETAKALNPSITSLIRTHNENDAYLFRKENLGKVFLGEHEIAMAMVNCILQSLEKEKVAEATRE